jgi:hypothetical protein
MKKYLLAIVALTLFSTAAWAGNCAYTTGGCSSQHRCYTNCNADGTRCETHCD